MLGAGGMAYHLVEAMLTACPTLQAVALHNRTRERAIVLRNRLLSAFGNRCSFEISDSPQDAMRDADIITACTSSDMPILSGDWVKEGAHVNLAGAHGRTMREADDSLMQRAALVAVDKQDAAVASGEIAIPLERGVLASSKLVEIGAIINGQVAGREGQSA